MRRYFFRQILPSLAILLFVVLSSGQVLAATTGGGSATGITYDCALDSAGALISGRSWGDCTWQDLISAVNKAINYGTIFALAFTVVVLAYAGFIYMTSEGNPGKIQRAHNMFWSVAKGIFFILTGWMIVHLIVTTLTTGAVQQLSPV